MNHHPFRLSRLRAPRGTPAASLLVVLVFVAFGLLASTLGIADSSSAPRHLEASMLTFTDWLLGLW